VVIPRRSAAELRLMRRAGQVVAEMHERIRAAIRPGVTTGELDRIGREVLERRGASSNFLGYHGYPAVICVSVNEVVVHGIPGGRRLEEGDLVAVDCGAIVEGWHGDAAFTAPVGTVDEESRRLVAAVDAALAAAVAAMVAGHRLGDVSHAVERVIEGAGFGIVRDYCGHGIGRMMHERPDVPNFGKPGRGPKLQPGNVLAIEPMAVAGAEDVVTLADGWTVVTIDGRRSAHAEHTVVVTDHGPEILTRC
jgi:methionyl aminopeptidase